MSVLCLHTYQASEFHETEWNLFRDCFDWFYTWFHLGVVHALRWPRPSGPRSRPRQQWSRGCRSWTSQSWSRSVLVSVDPGLITSLQMRWYKMNNNKVTILYLRRCPLSASVPKQPTAVLILAISWRALPDSSGSLEFCTAFRNQR